MASQQHGSPSKTFHSTSRHQSVESSAANSFSKTLVAVAPSSRAPSVDAGSFSILKVFERQQKFSQSPEAVQHQHSRDESPDRQAVQDQAVQHGDDCISDSRPVQSASAVETISAPDVETKQRPLEILHRHLSHP